MKQQKLLVQKTPQKERFPISLVIAIYQLLGGLLGLGLLIKMAPALQNPSASTWLGLFLAALLYTFSMVCGFLLFKQRRNAYTLSLVNQILQVFSFGVAGLAYNFVAGVKVGIGIDFLENWHFKLRLSISSFHFSVGSGTVLSFVSVNLLALLLIYLLEKGREEAKKNMF